MPNRDDTNDCSPSTTWALQLVKISRRPQGQQTAPKGRHAWRRLSRLDHRKVVTLKIRYRGGAQCFVEVHARGVTAFLQGTVPLFDVLEAVTNNL